MTCNIRILVFTTKQRHCRTLTFEPSGPSGAEPAEPRRRCWLARLPLELLAGALAAFTDARALGRLALASRRLDAMLLDDSAWATHARQRGLLLRRNNGGAGGCALGAGTAGDAADDDDDEEGAVGLGLRMPGWRFALALAPAAERGAARGGGVREAVIAHTYALRAAAAFCTRLLNEHVAPNKPASRGSSRGDGRGDSGGGGGGGDRAGAADKTEDADAFRLRPALLPCYLLHGGAAVFSSLEV